MEGKVENSFFFPHPALIEKKQPRDEASNVDAAEGKI